MTVLPSKTLSISIERGPEEVYAYVTNPVNFPEWVTSFVKSIRRSGEEWIVETTEAPITLKFVDNNDYGVADHWVTVATGQTILNPMRVVLNGSGCEVVFTAYRQSGVSEESFANDTAMIESDLRTLKRIMEK
ncbi:SRPBCC family protein [Paenibacillus elgii]|uniref:SRPBCC family protein n=1 Tax=Paenibacillus elgii TaxID=189691 RepID=UPI00203C31AB|nr:SRPBCC family protein [Paenibacillus elgii]MCM3273484.1 SRPBCC family protein [Paenibacillus elgii]